MAELAYHQTTGAKVARYVIYAVLIAMVLFYLAPLFVMLSTSFKSLDEIRTGNLLSLPSSISFDAWRAAWSSACTGIECGGMAPYFSNSLKMMIPAVLISTLVGAFNGYILSMWRFKGSDTFFLLLLIGTFLPFQVIILPMAQVLGMLEIEDSTTRLILVHVIYGLQFTTLFFRNYYVTVPGELVSAARIDGAGFFRIFFKILLPISIPTIMVCLIWQTTQIWNDFLFGVIFSSGDGQPITVALNNLVNTSTGVKQYNVDMAAAIIAALPTLIVYAIGGKYFVRGLTAGAVKG
ncbi:carbohydrate ABC transporter permease [Chitinimonas taiwanensis]|uniref:Glucose/mannose transport system permease protein n=2 Tax=Chitinimonas TaxID=240411 RepID=A0A1K2HGD6_9NEIS|nr:carbohydrate ABC transporter permease [Chitinimonas taiwanensis]SFZ75803.1 glucose/mannose transport system permease protein [Chitinimonas taiwanensis DSM 18899]